MSVSAQNFNLLSLELFRGLVQPGVSKVASLGRWGGLDEELIHFLLDYFIWVIDVVDVIVEVELSLYIFYWSALQLLAVRVIEIRA